MNDRRENILLALLNSGLYQSEWKNYRGMANRADRDSAAACAVVAACICIDRAMGDLEHQEIEAADTYRCEIALSGEHSLEKPNGKCKFCGKIWTGTKWLKS